TRKTSRLPFRLETKKRERSFDDHTGLTSSHVPGVTRCARPSATLTVQIDESALFPRCAVPSAKRGLSLTNASIVPSGDHRGALGWSAFAISLGGDAPAASITYNPRPYTPSPRANAILEPSGDQLGEMSDAVSANNFRGTPPSAGTTYSALG